MFKIIRCALDYGLVIAEQDGTTPHGTEQKQWLCWRDWKVGNKPTCNWFAIDERGVQSYFSGQADGLGWGLMPQPNSFETLQELDGWLEDARREFYRKAYPEINFDEEIGDDV